MVCVRSKSGVSPTISPRRKAYATARRYCGAARRPAPAGWRRAGHRVRRGHQGHRHWRRRQSPRLPCIPFRDGPCPSRRYCAEGTPWCHPYAITIRCGRARSGVPQDPSAGRAPPPRLGATTGQALAEQRRGRGRSSRCLGRFPATAPIPPVGLGQGAAAGRPRHAAQRRPPARPPPSTRRSCHCGAPATPCVGSARRLE